MTAYENKGYLDSQFRIFHLKDTQRQDFNYHFHDFDKIVLLLQGKVTYHIEGNSYPLNPYDLVLVHHHELHRPTIDPCVPYERIILYLSPDLLKSYQNNDYDLSSCFLLAKQQQSHVMRADLSKVSPVYQTIKKLDEAYGQDHYANELYCHALLLEFMIHLNRIAKGDQIEYLPSLSQRSKVFQIITYINEHLTKPLSIDEIAGCFYLSKYHMMRQFKEETGFTIGQYITQKRLLMAKDLLKTGQSITTVCYECGFHNYSTFFRAYKSLFGKSPRQSSSQKEAT